MADKSTPEDLTPEEIEDVRVSKLERAQGKSKRFTKVEDLLKDLNSTKTEAD